MGILKTSFKPSKENPYNSEFVAGIKESERQIREGRKTRISGKDELKKFLELNEK